MIRIYKLTGWVNSEEQSCFSYNHIFWYCLYLHQWFCWFKLKKQIENIYMMTYTIEYMIMYI